MNWRLGGHRRWPFGAVALSDVVGIAALSLTVVVVVRLFFGPDVDVRTPHLGLALATVAVLGAVAVLEIAGAPRSVYECRWGWLGAAFGLYAATVAMEALGPLALSESASPATVLAALDVAVVALLLARCPARTVAAGHWPWGTAAAALTLAVVATGRAAIDVRGLEQALVHSVVGLGVAVGWMGAALGLLVIGITARRTAEWRVGLGLLLIGLAHGCAASGIGLGRSDLTFAGFQLLGGVAVLGGVVQHMRDEIGRVAAERAELRLAAEHGERVASRGAERDHELANGLAGLAGIVHVLDQPRSSEEAGGLRVAVLHEVARLRGMLVRAPCPDEARFDVAPTLSELAALRRAAGMDIVVEAEDGLAAAGDRSAFAQVVTNLLANCERHAAGCRVRIQAWGGEGDVAVEVRDDGPGSAEQNPRRLLERGRTAGPTGGSGLGLHLSSRLMEEQGGGLRVLPNREGEHGFGVRIELARADASVRARSGSDGSGTGHRWQDRSASRSSA